MAKQTINPGTAPTGAGGDTFRSGSAKLQANDDELYNQLGATPQGVLPAALPINKGGTGATSKEEARAALEVFKRGEMGLGTQTNGLTASQLDTKNELGTYSSFWSALYYGSITAGITMSYSGDWFAQLRWVEPEGLMFRSFRSGTTFGAWRSLWHTGNSWVDANGFIKSASPIVKLFSDKIEPNDEAQQQNITFEKLGVGDYLIKGSLGFAQEGWYIETPKDANGNVLFSVIYTTLENGDISVKTYKKKFDFETVSIVADLDNPVDITENRWIDLRLQELPQPEIEIPEPITPPDFQPTGLAQAVATVMESYHDPEQ